jgi:hypothetical protein
MRHKFTIRQFERLCIDHPATIPSKEAASVTENGDRERKDSKLGTMDSTCVGDQLTTSPVSTGGEPDVAGNVFWIGLEILDPHKGIIPLGSVFDIEFNATPLEPHWRLRARVRGRCVQINGDIGFERIPRPLVDFVRSVHKVEAQTCSRFPN